ncbi:MAG TPA: NAD(P)/FAD-dependent oxidoreductase [Pseudonocardia sp.]|uniref:NAD(P)/FAD-dependent oxidoreductase n=1 Tax=Pseudonocardia sp. TaxID=60912 RepID=UPI002F3F2746
MHTDLLIIGGGPAALSAATGYRDAGGPGSVLLVSEEDTAPYLRPPLSKEYLRGETEQHELALQHPGLYTELAIDSRLDTRVSELDAQGRRAKLGGGEWVHYGSCVLATGAVPRPLPVPGADDPAVAYLRSLHSARQLRESAEGASSAVVIGSGFIGCEAAVSLARRGVRVNVLSAEPLPQHGRLGAALGRRIAGWLAEEDVRFIGDATVTAIERGHRVHLGDSLQQGEQPVLEADLVLVAAGVTPRCELAARAGARIHQQRVVVDERMRTDQPGLLAAGDVAYAHNAAAGRHLVVEHWGEALAMGTIAGTTAAGGDTRWARAPGFWSMIGEHTLKYVAWGDGYQQTRLVDHGGGAFTVWYSTEGVTVGVATHQADNDYERGRHLVEQAKPPPDQDRSAG